MSLQARRNSDNKSPSVPIPVLTPLKMARGSDRYLNNDESLVLVGRIMLSLIFVMSGVGKIFDWSGTTAYMESKGMPAVLVMLALAIVFEIAGGLSIMTGFKTPIGAAMLIAFLIPASFVFHNFWAYPPEEQQIQKIMFMKKLVIMGGLLFVLGRGPEPLSLDERSQTNTRIEPWQRIANGVAL